MILYYKNVILLITCHDWHECCIIIDIYKATMDKEKSIDIVTSSAAPIGRKKRILTLFFVHN